MRTLGVDLSAENQRTWAATVDWDAGGARLVELVGMQSDDDIADKAAQAAVVGVDCPLGWPDEFVSFVSAHQRADSFVGSVDLAARRQIAFRETDRAVIEQLGGEVRPLSVAADKLGLVAVRCAGLLGTLNAKRLKIDRTGASGVVVEVYPAASLRAWGFEAKKYKRPENRNGLKRLVESLSDQTQHWLDIGDHRPELERSDDAFDALIAALTARAARTGHTASAPTEEPGSRFAREGWIHVPVGGSLSSLA